MINNLETSKCSGVDGVCYHPLATDNKSDWVYNIDDFYKGNNKLGLSYKCKYCYSFYKINANKNSIAHIASARSRRANQSAKIIRENKELLQSEKHFNMRKYNNSLYGIAAQRAKSANQKMVEVLKLDNIKQLTSKYRITQKQVYLMIVVSDMNCVISNNKIENYNMWSLEHIVPFSKNGTNNPTNIIPVHYMVNCGKNGHDLDYYCDFHNYNIFEVNNRIAQFHDRYFKATQLLFTLQLFGINTKFGVNELEFYEGYGKNKQRLYLDFNQLLAS